jgi:hypothetical protein
MKQQKLLKSANIGMVIGILVVAVSFLISLVPCKKEAGIGVCRLPNPFSDLTVPLTQKYYFISNNPLTGLILQFLIPLVIVLLITMNHGSKKQEKEKFVDYTKK